MEQAPAKATSFLRKRAKTWEISDSEEEETVKDEPKVAEQEKSHVEEDPAEKSSKDVPCAPEPDCGTREPSGNSKGDSGQLCVEDPSGLLVPLSKSPSPYKRTRKKKSPEELEAERAQAEERKRLRELQRQEKQRMKDLEKEERERRKESAQALKLLRPDQCGKYMTVQVDAGLLQDAGSEDLLQALTSAGYNHSIEPHAVPWSITWRREMPDDWTCFEGLELCKGEEDQMVIMVQPKDFVSSVSSYMQAPASSRSAEVSDSTFGIAQKHPEKRITLAVLGLHDYRRWQRLSHKMERHSLETRDHYNEKSESHVTRHQIDEALVFLQLYRETEVLFLDTWRDLGQHICAMTKSIAQRPFRKHWDAQSYSFCTSAGTWRGWGPRGSVTGLPLAWRRQIQQFNRVSPAMAAAITEAYPSPQLLMQAYAACSSDKERLALLSNLKVPRIPGTMEDADNADAAQPDAPTQSRERRIGPDLSRRIWLFMTSTNPELLLDLNS
ncbi:putative crossover junction endonuclease EME2 [Gastrophryne carolinensis]